MEEAIFNEEKLIKILTRRKNQLKEGQTVILNKLRRKEKLSEKEFWSIFELIRQEGPEVSYSNPNNWNDTRDYLNN
jgi:hypothetical protein